MSIALCMLVKDEANRIDACLAPLVRLVDEVVIIDTGSSDGTQELIEGRWGIRLQHGRLDEQRCLTKIDLRNHAFSQVRTNWILSIDADERIDPAGLAAFREHRHDPRTAGYFGLWRNHLEGEAPFDDYKCFLFRRGYRMSGLVHENAQIDIRRRGARALWLDALTVDHHPERAKHANKTQLYYRRLADAIRLQPHWHRYHWFLGYLQFQLQEFDQAMRNLTTAFESDSLLFPVERLNSAMVLAEVLCRLGHRERAQHVVRKALALWESVREDFEVAINTRIEPWLRHAESLLAAGESQAVRAYRFAR
jgi:glycosyltransferase involved in cell wall biosynthesis